LFDLSLTHIDVLKKWTKTDIEQLLREKKPFILH